MFKLNRKKDVGSEPGGPWERDLIERLATSALQEQRRARRWGIFFKLLVFAYLIGLAWVWMPDSLTGVALKSVGEHTAVVDVSGVIADETKASADNIIASLRAAFEDKKTKGVILRINSPGGSPVQAGAINDEVKRLKEKHPDMPVYAVVTDLCASGGYYIAVAADEIYVDKASIVGSIGVLMNGFGFVEGMKKLGVERRLLTAGEHKAIMDPFSPVSAYDQQHVARMLETIHQQFIDTVKTGRGERLKDDAEIFSGLFWTGEESVALGLVDGLGSSSYVARELIKAEEMVEFKSEEEFWDRFARRLGAGAASVLTAVWGMGPQLR